MAQRGFDPTMNTIKTIAQPISELMKFVYLWKSPGMCFIGKYCNGINPHPKQET